MVENQSGIANGKYTNAVDEVLLKVIDAKQKEIQIDLQGVVIMEKHIYNEQAGIRYIARFSTEPNRNSHRESLN